MTAAVLASVLLSSSLAAHPVEAPKPPPPGPQIGDLAPRLMGIYADGDSAVASRPRKLDGHLTLLIFWRVGEEKAVRLLEQSRDLLRSGDAGPRFRVVAVATSLDPYDWSWQADDAWEPWIEFLRSRTDLDRVSGMTHLMEAEFFTGAVVAPDANGLTSSSRYAVRSLPAIFLIAPDGRVLATNIPLDRVREVVLEATER